jgi:hypothetical protein
MARQQGAWGGADLADGATRFRSASGSDTVVGSSTTSLISGCEHDDDVPVAGRAVDLVDGAVHLFESQRDVTSSQPNVLKPDASEVVRQHARSRSRGVELAALAHQRSHQLPLRCGGTTHMHLDRAVVKVAAVGLELGDQATKRLRLSSSMPPPTPRGRCLARQRGGVRSSSRRGSPTVCH